MIQADFDRTFEGWRRYARPLVQKKVHPNEIAWGQQTLSLPLTAGTAVQDPKSPRLVRVPSAYFDLAESIAYARDEDRWDLLYRLLYRLAYENSALLEISTDSDVHRALLLAKSVRRDIHKMHAFVRFKQIREADRDIYVAWHQPEHPIIRPGTPFFVRRFGDRPWSIFTPEGSAHWDLKELTFGPGMEQHEFNHRDHWDDVWKSYYKSIFNPSRIKINAMKKEMAPKYWKSMPETELIAELIRQAPARLQDMSQSAHQEAKVLKSWSMSELTSRLRACTSCPLSSRATQTVVGQGPHNAEIMIIGEQPGDEEDRSGEPFVGPAGRVLNELLQKAGLKRDELYLTNAVKHFKWAAQGKIRLHQKPNGHEMHACRSWLLAEIEKIKPKIIIALGATAATSLLGRLPKIRQERGQLIKSSLAPHLLISWHPSAILRSLSPEDAKSKRDELLTDLKFALRLKNH